MKKSYLLLGGMIIILVVVMLTMSPTTTSPVDQNGELVVADLTSDTFLSSAGESVTLTTRSDSSAIYFEPGSLAGIILTPTSTETGLKYVDGDAKLVVWRNDEQLAVTHYDAVVFLGYLVTEDLDNGQMPPDTISIPGTPDQPQRPTTNAGLIGTWYVTEIVTEGEGIPSAKLTPFSLTFNQDGTMGGTTDCNNFGGSYTIQNDTLTFGPFFQTLMYCEDSMESVFIAMLANSLAVSLGESSLKLTSQATPSTVIILNKNQRPNSPVATTQKCFVGGCSSQVCSDDIGVVTTCEYKPEYACYASASCERQASGQCGWTMTPELTSCLANGLTQ